MGHVVHMGDKREAYRVFVWQHEGTNHLEDLDVDGRIILTLTLLWKIR